MKQQNKVNISKITEKLGKNLATFYDKMLLELATTSLSYFKEPPV